MKTLHSIAALLLTASLPFAGSCGTKNHHGHHDYHRPVSLAITVVDQHNAVWEGMVVRIVEAWNEWSDDYRQGKDPWATLETDDRGLAYFDSEDLSAAELGFLEAPEGIAVLSNDFWKNQAEFTVEVGHPTLGWIKVAIPISYKDNHLDVEIEFEG